VRYIKVGFNEVQVKSLYYVPLLIAASLGQTKHVELLFLQNDKFSLGDKDSITAILAASINGHQNTVLFIVQ
jgi:ankyrin repeat protein